MNEEKDILFLGYTTFRKEYKKFGIKLDDRRRHVYILGKTGCGKSSLLLNMALQDIMNGKGIGFLDPHGEAVETLLKLIPSWRINDVVYFNPSDIDFPISFNVMEKPTQKEYRHIVASGLLSVFKKIWPDVWSARMEYILHNTILALLESPNSTILGINRMLSDPEYRNKIVEKIEDPIVKSFWTKEFARYTQRYEIEATAAIQNKVGQFISNPLIRNIVGQLKTKLNMRKIMDEKKIFLANLSKGRIGEENSNLLGALLVTTIQIAAMSRVEIPEEKREDFFLYIDEFQNFATESFATILSEARKYRLSLILAHQYLAQLDEMTSLGKSTKVRDAIFGNVGTMIIFRIGPEDALFLEDEFKPKVSVKDLVELPKYHAFVKLMIDGITTEPFSAVFPPPPKIPEKTEVEKIIRLSREKYATHRKKIEEKIEKWAGNQPLLQTPKIPELFDAICKRCGKNIKVPFLPDNKRPVYCKSCLKKIKKSDKNNPSLKKTLKEVLKENENH
jgi:CxxC-x17-CxxC domain-containing protein